MAEINITKDNFTSEVMQSSQPVLLDFWASWCGPCRMLSPVVSALAEKYEGKLKVGKVNVDEQPELADAFKVASIPFVLVFKGGRIINQFVGYRPAEQIEAMLAL